MEEAVLQAEARKGALEASAGGSGHLPEATAAPWRGCAQELEQVTAEVDRLYARWQELDRLRGAG